MILEAVLIGIAAGLLSGLLGVGGGALFVPALVLVLGLDQIEAEATSLLAIVPVAAVGATPQDLEPLLKTNPDTQATATRPVNSCTSSTTFLSSTGSMT